MSTEISTHEQPRRRQRGLASASMWIGLVLILLGTIFVLQRWSGFVLRNWWALFILIPALVALGTAWTLYRRKGRFTYGVCSILFPGLIVLLVALMFLFHLSWGVFWPLFVLLPGLAAMFSGLPLDVPSESRGPLARRLHQYWLAWLGGSTTLLGLAFLSRNLGVFDPAVLLPNWWAIFILIPAAGGLITTFRLLLERGGFDGIVVGNLAVTLTVGVVGFVGLLGIDWNLLNALVLIAVGVALLFGVLRGGRQREGD